MTMTRDMSRRDFIKKSSITAAGVTTAYIPHISSAQTSGNQKSKVVIAKDENCIEGSSFNLDRVQDMVDHAIIELTGINNTSRAYEALFPEVTLETTIVIKRNTKSGEKQLRHHVPEAVKTGLTKMFYGQFPSQNVTITDGEGQTISPSNPKVVVGSTEWGIQDIWVNSDYIINVPACWGHSINGVTLSLKNMMSCIRPGPGNSLEGLHKYTNDSTNPWTSILNAHPVFKEKQVLVLMDAICCRSNGGPGGSPNFLGYAVYASKDMIATDYLGTKLLQENGLRTQWVDLALETFRLGSISPYEIGTNKEEEMEIVEITPPWDATGNFQEMHATELIEQVEVVSNSKGTQVIFTIPKLYRKKADVTIFNMKGKKIWSYSGTLNTTLLWPGKDVRGRYVPQGMYVYHYKVDTMSYSGKIHINR